MKIETKSDWFKLLFIIFVIFTLSHVMHHHKMATNCDNHIKQCIDTRGVECVRIPYTAM